MVAGETEATAAQQVAGTVRIGAPDGFGTMFLAPRLGELVTRHPRLSVEIIATPRLFSLAKREADIVIGLSSPTQSRVVSRRLVNYRLYLYASNSYLSGAPPITTLNDILNHTIIGYVEELAFAPEVNYLDLVQRFHGTTPITPPRRSCRSKCE
jgi:DNA-binding transcriptional LysR family regulator